MHLKSLTLKGFKSFANPTALLFEPGVTCVVGPNGSGKSNVVDALAWVMGEQGAKSLRGGKMEDVIFAGTATRGPLGRAEVTLTIDNADGLLPIDYAEVTIRRTLFRGGASEYAINGEAVRLLDVQELLSDTGLGREMHVIVGQGRLDSVLHATPEERRGFIEEAAGILKHRRRKEKTLRKLEGMEGNLTRLRDLTGELRRQLKPLGRQAQLARRAHGIAAIVRDAKARLAADETVRLTAALRQSVEREQSLGTERQVLQEQLAQAVAGIELILAEQQGDRVDRARRSVLELETVAERLRNLQLHASQRRGLVRSQLSLPVQAPTVTAAEVEAAESERAVLQGRSAAADAQLADSRARTSAATEALAHADRELAQWRAAVSRHELQRTQLQSAVEQAAARLAQLRGEVLRQRNARDGAGERMRQAAAQLLEVEQAATEGERDAGGLDIAYTQAQTASRVAEGELESSREQEQELARELEALRARRQTLELATAAPDGTAALLAAGLDGVRGLVAEGLRVEAGAEAAVAAALGAVGEAVLVEGAAAALEVLARSRGDGLGRVELVVEHGLEQAPSCSLELPEQVTPIAPLLHTAPQAVRALLQNAVLVPDLATAARVLAEHSGLPGLVVVTAAGEVLTASVYRGGSGGEGASRIELGAELQRSRERQEEVESGLAQARRSLLEARQRVQDARAAAEAALGSLRRFDAELAAGREQLNRAQARSDSAVAEHARAARALDAAEAGVPEAEERLRAAKATVAEHAASPPDAVSPAARQQAVDAVEQAREGEVEARLAVQTLRERLRAEQQSVERLHRQLAADRAVADAQARARVEARVEQRRVERVLAALPTVLEAVQQSLHEAVRLLRDAEAQREAHSSRLRELRSAERRLRERISQITEQVHALELSIYEQKLQRSALLERARSELGLSEEILVAEYGPHRLVPGDDEALRSLAERAAEAAAEAVAAGHDADADGDDADADDGDDADADAAQDSDPAADEEPADGIPFDRAEQQRRLAAAERQLAQLGRINPLALEEFAALEQRAGYLAEQLADLERTRDDLLQIVTEIDERMRNVFAAAFDDTRRAFHEVFPVLFPGGSGDILLTAPDDLLRTGIEVSVKPAGKRIERLTLLSGGERSLAAVALLIAIFKARPSPFYIMDEVEAALDGANLGRLLAVFEQLRASSQLIIITHQQRTMEIADALYGVSMRQDGVSAVVGQRIAAREPEAG